MLYDVRKSQFFGGVSLWCNDDVNPVQPPDELIQNADYKFSYSIEEARKNCLLDVEGSLSLDLKILSATGSAKYLSDSKSSAHEARINASCTVVRRTRRIPQETLTDIRYENYLDDDRYTHYVGEVTEGGSATLSFVQSCSSAEEAKRVTGELKVSIVKIPVSGSAKIEFAEDSDSKFENVKISYSGAIAEQVATLDDARRVAREMPTKLAKQMNTLHYKLMPLSLLDSKASRLIRSLDTGLIADTAETLKAGKETGLRLRDVAETAVFQGQFPSIQGQIRNFREAYSAAEIEFQVAARKLLPELRDGRKDEKEKTCQLREAVARFKRRTAVAENFAGSKRKEALALQETVAALLADRFENHLGGFNVKQLTNATPRLFVSFGGPSIGTGTHPLQRAMERDATAANGDDADDADDTDDTDDNDSDEEWFENAENVARLTQSCASLRKQRALAEAAGTAVVFGVASIDKAYRPGARGKSRTSVGDIVLSNQGKLHIITLVLAKTPTAPQLAVAGQDITVQWQPGRNQDEEAALPATGYVVCYCRRSNPLKDGAFPRAVENEPPSEAIVTGAELRIVLRELKPGCDYEVAVSMQTCVGPTEWGLGLRVRTAKRQSVAADMITFFGTHRKQLTRRPGAEAGTAGHKPWEMQEPQSGTGKKTLFLGQTEIAQRKLQQEPFRGDTAVRASTWRANSGPR
ncbi:Down syndrome cell adhesion molecule-like protein 1 [Microdochium nivale]|nr:Down syndrome cell adhesion molecule-like protein 1 [Microdochium nivale]